MGTLDYVSVGLLVFMGYLVVYSLINRVCRCIEHCATARAYGELFGNDNLSNEFKNNLDDFLKVNKVHAKEDQ